MGSEPSQPPLPGSPAPQTQVERERRGRRSWPQRVLLAIGIMTSFVLFGSAAVVALGWNKVNSFERVSVFLDRPDKSQPLNFLFVGSDSRAGITGDGIDDGAFVDGSVSGRRSDTMMIVRIDQKAQQIVVLSIPRDLYVPIAGTGENDRINSAYGLGEQTLVDTITDYLNIQINHYVEVDFGGFKGLVDVLGGIPIYFDTPMRDEWTGLDVTSAGCHVLSGSQALAFARSRHLEVETVSGWHEDPTADLGRISRQQLFLRRSMDRASSLGLGDIGKVNRLLGVATANVTFDRGLSVPEAVGLVRKFATFSGDSMQTFSLPTTPFETSGGAAVLQLNVEQAQPTLDIFRGRGPAAALPGGSAAPDTPILPAQIAVTVLNGTGLRGQAGEVSEVLRQWGFNVALVGNSLEATQVRTALRYPPGAKKSAESVARAFAKPPQLLEDVSAGSGVIVVTGGDFAGLVDPPAAMPPAEQTTSSVVGITPPAHTPPGQNCK